MLPRYLTKSRYKLAVDCPTKLFYTGKKDLYNDEQLEDNFLRSLAEGGYQVGEFAKLYYPGGIVVDSLGYDEALAMTDELLKRNEVTIYEAAFCFENLFIRADILVKEGNTIKLIEVKAKSFHPAKDKFSGDGGLHRNWEPYLYDLAFQKYVIRQSKPAYNVNAYLLLADKSQVATVDGLNQLFYVYNDHGRIRVKNNALATTKDTGARILIEVNADGETDIIYNNTFTISYAAHVTEFASAYLNDIKTGPEIGAFCSKCQFRASDEQIKNGQKSGFNECWATAGLTAEQLKQPLVLELWNCRKKDELITARKYFLSDISEVDIAPKSKPKKNNPGLSVLQRQMLQVSKAANNDTGSYIDIPGLSNEMQQWKFPLHFIDFETTAVAIPFHAGLRPYEQIAFQFSHHTVQRDGTAEHAGEWINTTQGLFPNFNFTRELKRQLENDNGTIFRYAAHENTILNVIYNQLKESAEPDKEELCEWIRTITKSSSSSAETWEGKRNMVDLREIVLRYYYNPSTHGSNSIKDVLPAILDSSDYLKTRYDKPIYGSAIKSHNYTDHVWIQYDDMGKLINPYKLLAPINEEQPDEVIDELLADEETGIADGGAAMIAYAKMQFTEMEASEKEQVRKALFRYCELDTLAMVMIYEAWRQWCK